MENALNNFSDEKWYLLWYEFDAFSMNLQGVTNLNDADSFVVLRIKSNKVDCRVLVDQKYMDSLPEFEQFKHFVIGCEI